MTVGLAPLVTLAFRRDKIRIVMITTACLITFLGAALYFPLRLPDNDESAISFYHEQSGVTLKGLVSSAPEPNGQQTQLHFTAQEIKIDNQWQDISGTALVYVPSYSEYRYGDSLLLSGRLQTPPRFDDFNYRDYLAHQGISTIIFYPDIEILSHDQGSRILGWIYGLRSQLGQTLAEVLPEPQASLAQGISLGLRGNIPAELKQNFSRTGTAHILAISGLHLSIIAGIFLVIGLWLFGRRRYLYIWLALSAIWFYTLITGLHAPVVRGAIMASIFLIAELLGRQRSAITALAFAAALMVTIEPQILWTASFQMSFLAMIGLTLIFPKLQTMGRGAIKASLGDSNRFSAIACLLSDSLSVSMAAILTTWPLTAYYFGIIAFTGPLVNLLALPSLPGIIITSALTGGLGIIAPVLAQATGWLAWLFISYLLLVVNAFSAWPGSALEAGAGSTLLVWSYYPALAVIILLLNRRKHFTGVITRATGIMKTTITRVNAHLAAKWAVPPLIIITVLLSLAAVTMPDKKLHISILDVGQGESILIQTPSHQDILIDGGPDPQSVILELGRKMPFWDRTIDMVILTHPHADHVTGLVEVLKRYRVEQVLYPDTADDSPAYYAWLKLVEEKGIKSTFARAGQHMELGEGAYLGVLNPDGIQTGQKTPSPDDNGVVLELAMGDINFLLTADISEQVELALMSRRAIPPITVLKVAHHGSETATSPEFLAAANPQLAVISSGAANRFGHPSPKVIDRLGSLIGLDSIYRTDRDGTIEFITDGKRLWVKVANDS
jgi:competence protein ComEC